MTPRAALADVLARLTVDDNAAVWRLLLDRRERVVDSRGVWMGVWPSSIVPWRHPTPGAALEALVASTPSLVPAHWTDAARAPRWWCETCGGRGAIYHEDAPGPVMCSCMTRDTAGYRVRNGHTPAPPSHAALLAVASLGVDTLARAEALVAETWPGLRLVWQVMTKKALEERIRENHTDARASVAAQSYASETVGMWSERWPEACRFWVPPTPPDADRRERAGYDAARAIVAEKHRVYPTLRAIALTEGGDPTGLHLVALDASRVVLAVEALP